MNKVSKIIASFLPGIFLVGFNIGTGSVTAMAKAGADYGMSLLWALLLSCLVTFVLLIAYSRYTMVTGETAIYAFKKHIHPAVGIFFIVGLTVAVCGSIIGVMGIVSDVCAEWSKLWVSGGIDALYFALFFVMLVYVLFWNGQTLFFQHALAVIVFLMGLSFLVNFFILMPAPGVILKGLIPQIPQSINDSQSQPFLVVASMVGTTVASCIFIARSTLVKEAGWTIKDQNKQNQDALVSVILMFLISSMIMAAAAGTLNQKGIHLNHASQMVSILEPFAGRFAVSIFMTGIVAAGVSSQFPNILLFPWLLCDYNQSDRDMKKTKYRLIVLAFSLLGLIVPLFHASPVLVMIASQAFNAIILPLTAILIFYLGNKKSIMKEHQNSMLFNIALGCVVLFSLYMGGSGFVGFVGTLGLAN